MNNAKVVSKHSNIKPLTDEFYNLIEVFLDDSFELTEKNIIKFVNKLHSLDYQNKYEKMYPIKTENTFLYEGGINFLKKEITINVNKILNLDKNAPKEVILAYKFALLNSYFHETRHEKQNDICKMEGLTSTSYNRVMTYELLNTDTAYNQYSSLIEIDARLNATERCVDLIKRFDKLKNPEVCTFVMEECVSMLDGINDTAFDGCKYQNNSFAVDRLFSRIQNIYRKQFTIYKFGYEIFKIHFVSEFNEKMQKFKDETLKYLIFNVVAGFKLNDEIANFFKFDKNNKEEYIKFFFDNILTYDNYHFGNLIRLKAKETRDRAKEEVTTQDDIIEFFNLKNIKVNEKNMENFFKSKKALKEFEDYIKNKKKQNGYNDLLNVILNNEDENER